MQTPQRKGKYTSTLKSVHAEQLNKLQHKHQQEIDLLDDIRLFSKQRAAVEKDYAQALIKLGEQFLSKRKFPPPPNFKSEDGKDYKTVWTVWKTVLEETRRVGEMRLQAADTYLQHISEPAKPLKSSKSHVAKKVFEQCSVLQRELGNTVQEMTKANKAYSEEEHVANEARVKASDAEAKVKNRSTGLFTSLAKLQQASNKLNTRKEACEVKSTFSRNEYLINLAAANAHSSRFYNTELPLLIKTLDGDMYEKVQEYFTTLARSELECCGLTQECFMKILTDSCLVSREFNLQCFMNENQVFTECVQYKYDPQDDDPVKTVSGDHNATNQLQSETRKWTTVVARETKRLENSQKSLELLQGQIENGENKSCQSHEGSKGDKNDKSSVSSPTDPEQKMEDLKNVIRKAETSKLKAEAVLETLRAGGVDVESWLAKAEQEVSKEQEEDEKRMSLSVAPSKTLETPKTSRTESENTNSETQSIHNTSTSHPPGDTTYINYQDDDFVDDAFESSHNVQVESSSLSTGYASMTASGRAYPIHCVALYDFQAGNSDELNLTEHEQLELIADGVGDGWVRAKNKDGQEGLVPENYIHIYDVNGETDQNEMNVDSDIPYASSTAIANVALDTEQINATWDSAPQTEIPSIEQSSQPNGHTDTIGSGMSTYSSTDYEVQQTVAEQPNTQEGDWVKAMYDYDATCNEELSFQEGQMIRITRRDENGVDDGWWEGELNGKTGVFPSLVVEELSSAHHIQTANTPDRPGPPEFLPPDITPGAPQLAFTLPTPTDEHPDDKLVKDDNKENTESKNEENSSHREADQEEGISEIKADESDQIAYSEKDKTTSSGSQVTVEADVHAIDNHCTNKSMQDSGKQNKNTDQALKLEDDIAFADDDNSESVI